MANERTVEEFCAQQLARRAHGIAARLRDLAESVEREATRGVANIGKPGWVSYASVAGAIQHEIATTLFNLHVEELTTDAYDADAARIKGE